MKHAFSLIELLVAVAVIGILAATSVVTLTQLSSRSRDSSRRESLSAYATSLEQYKSSKGRYVVDSTINSGTITGYANQGWGRMTRSGIGTAYISTASIADILQQKGYLSAVQTDPSLRGLSVHTDIDSLYQVAPIQSNAFTDDFFLIVCSYNGKTQVNALSPSVDDGVEYALYGNLETPPPVNSPNASTRKQCGTDSTLGSSGSGDAMYNSPMSVSLRFNYSIGPSLDGH